MPSLAEFTDFLEELRVTIPESALSAITDIDEWIADNPNPVGSMQYFNVAVTSAELLALFATPKTLVAAPGAGYVLLFHGALVVLDYGGTAYDGIASNEDLAIRYTNASGVIASTTLETTGFLDATADTMRTFKGLVTDITPVANVPLVLHMTTAEIATGNSPLRVKGFYSVHETGL